MFAGVFLALNHVFKDYDEEENLKRLATAGMIFLNEVPSN